MIICATVPTSLRLVAIVVAGLASTTSTAAGHEDVRAEPAAPVAVSLAEVTRDVKGAPQVTVRLAGLTPEQERSVRVTVRADADGTTVRWKVESFASR